jgi:hypothetical protein
MWTGRPHRPPGTERKNAMHMLDWNTYRQQLVAAPAKPAPGLNAEGAAEISKVSASLIEDRIDEAGARVPPLAETPALRARAIVTQILRRRGCQL